jgi:hypothetical protein
LNQKHVVLALHVVVAFLDLLLVIVNLSDCLLKLIYLFIFLFNGILADMVLDVVTQAINKTSLFLKLLMNANWIQIRLELLFKLSL